MLSLERCIHLASVIEATASKPGNVHPGASFDDLTHADFVRAAEAAAPKLARASELGVGRSILEAVRAVRERCGSNVNLGIALLIAPLAAVPRDVPLAEGVGAVLDALTIDDAEHVFEAIRLAEPGGLGKVGEQDVATRPNVTLRQAMRLAADRDRIAAEYTERFPIVLEFGLPMLAEIRTLGPDWETVVIRLHLALMAEFPDTLIARKCGWKTARESARRAKQVVDAGWPDGSQSPTLLADLDLWLRADGHRRNPGTTADLVAASLFAALREQQLNIATATIAALESSGNNLPREKSI